jgi:hypothetical protein
MPVAKCKSDRRLREVPVSYPGDRQQPTDPGALGFPRGCSFDYEHRVRYVGPATHDDMVAAFLKAEIHSPRFGNAVSEAVRRLDVPLDVVISPDTADVRQNIARLGVWRAYRGVPPLSGLFDGFPAEVTWQWVALGPDEIGEILYIDWDYWLEVSGGTRRPSDAASRLGEDDGVVAVTEAIRAGRMPPPVVVVADPGRSKMVVLEGHVRLTAMVVALERLPAEVLMLLGTSQGMGSWPLY